MEWDDLRFVLAISRAAGLYQAARDLAVNPSSVYRRLDALEKKLGVRLFERLRSGYRLTIAGEEIAETGALIEGQVLSIERRIQGADVRLQGSVRIGTNEPLAIHLIYRHLSEFRTLYPDVRLFVTLSNDTVDLSRRDVDIVIRITDTPPDHLVGRAIARANVAAYASTAYLESHGRGRSLDEYDWIGYEGPLAHVRWARWITEHISEAKVVMHFDALESVRIATVKGVGCALMPCFVADDDPTLERLDGTFKEIDSKVWVLTHPDLRKSARIRACLQFFGSRLEGDKAKLEGTRIARSASLPSSIRSAHRPVKAIPTKRRKPGR